MKTLITVLVLCLCFNVSAKNLQAYFSYCTFYSPENGPYLETYLTVLGQSTNLKKITKGKFQSSIEVSIMLKQDTSIKYFDKYNLLSPLFDDSLNVINDFMDIQRIILQNGNYFLLISITDNNNKLNTFTLEQVVKVNYQPSIVEISDIELLASYQKTETTTKTTKSGFDLTPYSSNFFSKNMNHIKFYTEIYNTDKVLPGEPFLVKYFIESYERQSVTSGLSGFSKQTAIPVNVILAQFAIDNLPSGNYNLVIEARNKGNELLANKKLFFQRSNNLSPIEELKSVNLSNTFSSRFTKLQIQENLKCLSPISSQNELIYARNALGSNDTTIMQKYFQFFWEKRNADSPEEEWNKYYKIVLEADKLYHTKILKGYETDRGRIYLQYGLPDDKIISDIEPNSYPYEMWRYNKIETQSNVKFVFYNPDLVTNDFQLIHSTAIGEISNNQWKMILHNRNQQNTDFDDTGDRDRHGTKANDFFDD